ncbi:glycosyl transferase [Candidatus Pacearchaeota archaeon]|nr:glycosyl transferase [Candidatus Pacearchaeota archaeon]
MTKKKIMVLVVAYNAERTITNLLDRIPKEIWEKAEEIVVSDDSSQDKTTEVALNYKKKNKKKNLTVIRQEKNRGYGGNQKWGYAHAIEKGYDIVVMLHGDVQYSPEDMPRLLRPLEEGERTAMVFGSRMAGHPLRGGMPFYKYLGNIFLTTVENIVLRQRLSEFHSGYRLYSVNALKKIPFTLCSNDFHFDSEIIVQLIISKQRIVELPIDTHYGDEKCYVNVISYGLNVLNTMSKYLLSKWNLKKFRQFDKGNFNLSDR